MAIANQLPQNNVDHNDDNNNHHGNKFSFLVTMAFTLNYIIGSGFLTIPWAFSQTGCILGFIIMLLLYLLSTASANFLVETLARASFAFDRLPQCDNGIQTDRIWDGKSYQAIDTSKQLESQLNPISCSSSSLSSSSSAAVALSTFEIDNSSHDLAVERNTINNSSAPMLVGKHTFEVTELCDKFLGPVGVRIYSLFIALYFYGTLWAYSSVFANAFDAIFGAAMVGDSGAYEIFLVIFACIVVPISMLELTEQVYIQVALSIWRIVMLSLMIGSLFLSWWFHTEAFENFSSNEQNSVLYKFAPSKIYVLLPIATYAYIFHHSIPALSHPVSDKTQVSNIFAASLLVCFIAYLAVGTVVSVYFGDGAFMKHSSNLCWASYVGDSDVDHRSTFLRIVAAIVSKFVVLFPAVDVASAFPLNAITLGNNLQSLLLFDPCLRWLPLGFTFRSETIGGATDGDNRTARDSDENQSAVEIRRRYCYRALASVPPIIGAFFVKDLGKITNYSGLCGFAVAFVFPPLLAAASEKYLQQRGLQAKTAYGGSWRTGKTVRIITTIAGVLLIVYVLYCNIMGI